MKHKSAMMILCIIMFFFICRHCAFLGRSTLGALSSCMLYPILKIQQLVVEPIQFWLVQRTLLTELQASYASLQKDYELLRAENIILQSVSYYMQETIELSNFKKRYNVDNACIVQVLMRHFSPQGQFFLMNAGAGQGIKKDMVAIYNNCLIGKVIEVYPWYCKVCLITDVECKVAAVCTSTGATGILEGTNNIQSMTLRYVSHLDNVQAEDMVFSSGDGLIFPNGFGLGKIICAQKEDLFYEIDVKPLVDFHLLRYCIILSKDEIEGVGI